MKKLKLLNLNLLALSLLVASACSTVMLRDPSKYGKINQFSTSNKNSFTFSVDENYIEKNQDSKKSQDYPLMTEAEVKLLKALLKEKDYCKSDKDKNFFITSRQEKIFDVTFSHLIEQNYKAKPLAPRMYFGECQ